MKQNKIQTATIERIIGEVVDRALSAPRFQRPDGSPTDELRSFVREYERDGRLGKNGKK